MRSYVVKRRPLTYVIKEIFSELTFTRNVPFYPHMYLNDKKWEA